MRIYEVYYSDMQINAKFKTLQVDTAENFVSKYAQLPKIEYMKMVLETCVHNFRSDVLYSLAKMSKDAGDEALMSMYNGCIMLNPTLDADTWSNISYAYNIFRHSGVRELEPPQADAPNVFTDDDIIPDETVTPGTATKERKKKTYSIPQAKFANLENHLHSRVIGQGQAIKQVVDALKRSQAQLNDATRPLGVFLFAGPSGVGKTLIAKELQKYLFTGDIVRVDCGEYQHKHENQKLIGCFPAGAMVRTDIGILPIESVNIRSKVLTHEGDFKRVVCSHLGPFNGMLLKIRSVDNEELICTSNHEIYAIKEADHDIKNAKFYHAGQLNAGDVLIKTILTPQNHEFRGYSYHPIADVSFVPYEGRVYDLTVDARSTYTVSGFIVHNSPPGFIGHDEGGQLTREISKNPQTVLLLDEAEKAHPDFWNTFLKTFDEGYMTDNKGNKISFKDTVIIMTSNSGNDKVAEAAFSRKTGFTTSKDNGYASKVNPKRDMVERETMEAIRKHFKPEFLNRIDEIIVFNYLEMENYQEIAEMEFQLVAEKLAKQQYSLEWDYTAIDLLIALSGKSIEGARGMSKIRRAKIETVLADLIINNKPKKGTIFNILTENNDFMIVWN